MSNHYGFFNSESNDVMHSLQGSSLLPSTISNGTGSHYRPKGHGTYMYKDNYRLSIGLFCVRSLTKHTWINSNDVYLGKTI